MLTYQIIDISRAPKSSLVSFRKMKTKMVLPASDLNSIIYKSKP